MASIQRIEGKTGVSFKIVCDLGRDQTGKRIRKTMTYTPDNMTVRQAEKAAQKAAAEFEQKITQGYEVDNHQTFAEYAEYVLRLKEREGLKRSTMDSYRFLMERINPAIGQIKLKDLRPAHLNRLYENLAEKGIRRGGKAAPTVDFNVLLKERHIKKKVLAERAGVATNTIGLICRGDTVELTTAEAVSKALNMKCDRLFKIKRNTTAMSNKTVIEYHRLIHTILAHAEKEMLVPYNAASKATPPRLKQKTPNYFQPEQIHAILGALETEPLKWQVLTQLLMVTGCRRGEIVGLRWDKVDFVSKRILVDTAILYSVHKGTYEDTTKTNNRRYIPLPDETLTLLRRHRAAQNELRLANGERWKDTGFVFTQDDGAPMNPDSVTGWLDKFSKQHGLPHINPHAFRHTAASVLIAYGTDVVTTSKMLGHTRVSTTEDIYSHMIEESKQQASNILAEAYFRRGKAAH